MSITYDIVQVSSWMISVLNCQSPYTIPAIVSQKKITKKIHWKSCLCYNIVVPQYIRTQESLWSIHCVHRMYVFVWFITTQEIMWVNLIDCTLLNLKSFWMGSCVTSSPYDNRVPKKCNIIVTSQTLIQTFCQVWESRDTKVVSPLI